MCLTRGLTGAVWSLVTSLGRKQEQPPLWPDTEMVPLAGAAGGSGEEQRGESPLGEGQNQPGTQQTPERQAGCQGLGASAVGTGAVKLEVLDVVEL